MSPQAMLGLLEIAPEVEAQAREWHRQQLQKRLPQVAEEPGAVCPLTGESLPAACYEAVTLAGFRARERGPDWALKAPEANGSRVEKNRRCPLVYPSATNNSRMRPGRAASNRFT